MKNRIWITGALFALAVASLPLVAGACAQPTDSQVAGPGTDVGVPADGEPKDGSDPAPGAVSQHLFVDFQSATENVVAAGFAGAGVAVEPDVGQMDADAWQIVGLSDGDRLFGEEAFDGDHARGLSPGGVSSGGLYAFTVEEGNVALGVQPTASDFAPGSVTLRVPFELEGRQRFSLAYTIWVLNDEDRSSSWEVDFSTGDGIWSEPNLLPLTTDAGASESPTWEPFPFTMETELYLDELPDAEALYVRWTAVDHAGVGGRDEVAIDDIAITLEAIAD
jgi:hypothetical protein